MNKIRKTSDGLDYPIVLSEEFCAVDDDILCTASIKASKANIWQVIPVERFQKQVECMPRHVAAVIKANGVPTRY
ncbi:hypothetical protein TNCV_2612691 [Trichonephila clavipes]|nr:hypothetical protein TNCV_2612691 [Trichonephila clavipes]